MLKSRFWQKLKKMFLIEACIKIWVISQQKENFCLPKVLFLFIQVADLAYHRRAKRGGYHQPLWGWISSRASVYFLRLDDIQNCVLMIYRNKLRMIYKDYALIFNYMKRANFHILLEYQLFLICLVL